MKKILVFAVVFLTAATIFAQEKKAVIGVAKLTTTLSEATVEGYWGDYWGSPEAKDASGYTHTQTDYNTELKERAVVPANLQQVMQSLEYMLYDLFKDSNLFEKVVECNASGSDAKDVDYLVQPSLDMLYLERGIFSFLGPNSYVVDNRAVIAITVRFKDIKSNKVSSMVFYAGAGALGKDTREKLKNNGDYFDNLYVRNLNLTNPDGLAAPSSGLLGNAIKAAVNKNKPEKPKDDFLYEDLNGLYRLVQKIIINTYHKINPPTVQAVDENGIITFSALGFNEKDMLDVKNAGKRIAEIYVYDVKDRIAYAKVDPVDPEFSDAEIQEGFYISPAVTRNEKNTFLQR